MHDVFFVSSGKFLMWHNAMFVVQCLSFVDWQLFSIFRFELQTMYCGKPEISLARYDSESTIEGETELKSTKKSHVSCAGSAMLIINQLLNQAMIEQIINYR